MVELKWQNKSLLNLKIGKVEIGFPVVQAALSGYSDWPMRMLARQFGAGYALCEVMLDKFLIEVNTKRSKNGHLLYLERDHPVGGQLMGAEPKQFAAGAKKLVEAGFDIIDINFGCPAKKVLGRCRGGFHLSQPKVALEIIQRTREIVPDSIPVTIKMRRGLDDSSESKDHFFAILDGAFEAGIAGITVHGRTVEQRYKGPSNWAFLKEVKDYVGDKIILGSGDLFTPKDCLDMMAQTGVDGVTVARGAIGNPWIFAQALEMAKGRPCPDPPTLFEQRRVITEHATLATQLYGDRAFTTLRKFFVRYAASHPEYVEVRNRFVKVKNWETLEELFLGFYASDGPGAWAPPAIHQTQG
ncbi:MAG: tRNA-dihydrouridine synthase family protein [Pirellulaceae bacterium]|nr:tRNA-dihydrouridine synthase family protein [Pirellulaceae bacterium]